MVKGTPPPPDPCFSPKQELQNMQFQSGTNFLHFQCIGISSKGCYCIILTWKMHRSTFDHFHDEVTTAVPCYSVIADATVATYTVIKGKVYPINLLRLPKADLPSSD